MNLDIEISLGEDQIFAQFGKGNNEEMVLCFVVTAKKPC